MEIFYNVLVVASDRTIAMNNATAYVHKGGAHLTIRGQLEHPYVGLLPGAMFHITNGEGLLNTYGTYLGPGKSSESESYTFLNNQ